MERPEAIVRLEDLKGRNLRALAGEHDITVFKDGKFNKGWAGQTIERCLGLPLSSSRNPNAGSWELKVVPLVWRKNGKLVLKETMWITMVTAEDAQTPFESSHLLVKLRKLLVVGRVFEGREELHSEIFGASSFDLDNPNTYRRVQADYDLTRATIQATGFDSLTGRLGELIQPRTKGAGHGSKTRAFYARKPFVAEMLGLPT